MKTPRRSANTPPAPPASDRVRFPRLKARAEKIRERRATAGKTTVTPRAEPESSEETGT